MWTLSRRGFFQIYRLILRHKSCNFFLFYLSPIHKSPLFWHRHQLSHLHFTSNGCSIFGTFKMCVKMSRFLNLEEATFFNKIEPDISYKMYERIQSIQYLSFPIKSLKTFNNRICWHVTRDDFINKLQILSWFVKPILIFKIAFNNILCSAFAKPKTLQGQKFQFQSSFLFESKYSRQSALLIYLLKQFIFLTSILQLIKLWKFGHQNNEDS